MKKLKRFRRNLLKKIIVTMVSVFVITAGTNFKAYGVSQVDIKAVMEAIDILKSNKTIKNYNYAVGQADKLEDSTMKSKAYSEIMKYNGEIFTPKFAQVMKLYNKLAAQKDVGTYYDLTRAIAAMPKAEDREYLLEQIDSWSKQYIFTPTVQSAIAAIYSINGDSTSITKAETLTINKVYEENIWSMFYLETALNKLKYKTTQNKKQILILGDSLTLGMAVEFEDKKPKTKVEHTWWQQINKEKYNVNFLALGGLTLGFGLDMLEYADAVGYTDRKYDKIFITLGSNDYKLNDVEFYKALENYVQYVEKNYKAEEYVLVNFYYHEAPTRFVASKHNFKFVKVDMSNIEVYDKTLDIIHPSAKGHKQIFDQISTQLEF